MSFRSSVSLYRAVSCGRTRPRGQRRHDVTRYLISFDEGVIEVPSREAALEWAAKIAVACRCAQEVREFMPDPAVGNRA